MRELRTYVSMIVQGNIDTLLLTYKPSQYILCVCLIVVHTYSVFHISTPTRTFRLTIMTLGKLNNKSPFINESNKIYFSIMPEGLDPDDYIKKNGKTLMSVGEKNTLNINTQENVILSFWIAPISSVWSYVNVPIVGIGVGDEVRSIESLTGFIK